MTDSTQTSLADLPKQYEHNAAQQRWTRVWQERGCFHAEPDLTGKKFPNGPFTIVIPPPNVTGALHLGHALNNTLQDILIRAKRMQGFNALWMPGTDHAGIATQAVVERRLLEEEKKTRHDLGRDKLVERIWDWKREYEQRILAQLKSMGCSCDWERVRFTLDEQCARAVRQTFFAMFKAGKIYRGKRLVNWDCFLQTAVSDDEVNQELVKGHFWHFRYPVIDPQPGEPTHVTIATTRPATMLGDTAVAVHPDPAAALDLAENELQQKLTEASAKDKPDLQKQLDALAERRKTHLPLLIKLRDMAQIGRKLMLPLVNREIPLVADEWAKPELGSGCVKITPGHDQNDYAVGIRQNLPTIDLLNLDGTINAKGGKYEGLLIKKAHAAVVADLEALGLLERIEDREISMPFSDRSKTPIEPIRADQWFVRMGDDANGKPGLSQTAMDAVIDARVKIHPERYAKSYLDWLSEKRDWPVSRQLWWGHRIPVWSAVLRSDKYIEAEDSIIKSLARVKSEFFTLLNEYSSLCQVSDQIAITTSEHSDDVLFICAESEAAEKVLFELHQRSIPPVYLSGPGSKDQSFASPLGQSDPRLKLEEQLNALAIFYEQDPNVLDTWFSSALWPHSTLGWPEQTPELQYFYPTNVLVTSRDIITLWVARMVLTGLFNVGEVPFRDVFIHPKILDGYGETMSKSKGNGVDPLDIIAMYGADSLRFGLAHMATETQDVRMPVEFVCPHCGKTMEQTQKNRTLAKLPCAHCGKEFSTQWAKLPADTALPRGAVTSERFAVARNFCNKLWNAARFTLLNLEGYTPAPIDRGALLLEDRWLLSRLNTVTQQVTAALETFRFADAARALYDFAWDEFCSFYVEMIKTRLQDPLQRANTQRLLAHALDVLLRLLHPIVPFVTEEVWALLNAAAPQRGLDKPTPPNELVITAPWPVADAVWIDPAIELRFSRFQTVLGAIREIRSRQNIAPRVPLNFSLRCEPETAALLEPMMPYFAGMAGATALGFGPNVVPPALAANSLLPGLEIFVDLAGHIDVAAERQRANKELEKLLPLIAAKMKKLENADFVKRAPAEVIAKERDQLAEMHARAAGLERILTELKGQGK